MHISTRLSLIAVAGLTTATAGNAQGVLLPRPCVAPNDAPIACSTPVAATIVRTRSDVHVTLANGVLRYEVSEDFRNNGARVGEADYMFPLPRGAAFKDLSLVINGEAVTGETMNATDARTVYEDIVRRQRDPALVEMMGYGLLRARIFPINPGEEKRVVVRFESVAEREGDALRVDYFSGGKTGTQGSGTAPEGAVHLTLSYPGGSGYGRPYSPTHELDVSDDRGQQVATVRGDARDATILVPLARTNQPSISMLANAPGGEDGFALITIAPPTVAARTQVVPRDVTLVLDISGSMQGAKIAQARAAGKAVLATLGPQDRFRLVDFATDVHTFRDDFVNATSANIRDAQHYLDALEAEGSTNLSGALTEAMRGQIARGHMPLMLLVTDGEPTIGITNADQLLSMLHPSGDVVDRRVFTFGLGSDVNTSLLEQLAMEGHGTSQFVRPDESVERAVGIVASRLVNPVLTNVRVTVDGNVHLGKMLPASGSDLFAGQDLVVLARYSGNGPARITVEGTHDGQVQRWTDTVSFPDRDRDNPFVARLWATQRVGFLSSQENRNGSSPEVDNEIRTLGERFGVPTKFTSYLVREPAMAQPSTMSMARGAAGGGGGRGGQAAMTASATLAGGTAGSIAPRDAQFQSAKTAAEQRSSTSLAAADSIQQAVANSSGRPVGPSTRMIAGRTFTLVDSIWTDRAGRDTIPVMKVAAYSDSYFAILDRLPELRDVFALGERVSVAGRHVAIVVDRAGSATPSLSAAQLASLVKNW